jgi:2-(1,2-epoxy-1,2-dihydrophenyl)acetyl-CoA isomerase
VIPALPDLPELSLEWRGPAVATITIERPAKRNALSTAMLERLPELLGRVAASATARVCVLTGAGGDFSAGGDI